MCSLPASTHWQSEVPTLVLAEYNDAEWFLYSHKNSLTINTHLLHTLPHTHTHTPSVCSSAACLLCAANKDTCIPPRVWISCHHVHWAPVLSFKKDCGLVPRVTICVAVQRAIACNYMKDTVLENVTLYPVPAVQRYSGVSCFSVCSCVCVYVAGSQARYEYVNMNVSLTLIIRKMYVLLIVPISWEGLILFVSHSKYLPHECVVERRFTTRGTWWTEQGRQVSVI